MSDTMVYAFPEDGWCMFKEPVMNDTKNKFHSAQCEQAVCACLASDVEEMEMDEGRVLTHHFSGGER